MRNLQVKKIENNFVSGVYLQQIKLEKKYLKKWNIPKIHFVVVCLHYLELMQQSF